MINANLRYIVVIYNVMQVLYNADTAREGMRVVGFEVEPFRCK